VQGARGEDVALDSRKVWHREWGSTDGVKGALVGKDYLERRSCAVDDSVVVDVFFTLAGVRCCRVKKNGRC
jgi:hypothetical protein